MRFPGNSAFLEELALYFDSQSVLIQVTLQGSCDKIEVQHKHIPDLCKCVSGKTVKENPNAPAAQTVSSKKLCPQPVASAVGAGALKGQSLVSKAFLTLSPLKHA